MLDMIGLSDEMLPLLVEYNPMITVEILMIILKNKNKEEIKRYLRQITNINVTLQSLEGTWSQLFQFWSDEYILRSPKKSCESFGHPSWAAIWLYTLLYHAMYKNLWRFGGMYFWVKSVEEVLPRDYTSFIVLKEASSRTFW